MVVDCNGGLYCDGDVLKVTMKWGSDGAKKKSSECEMMCER